jgi:hypothetical protein
VPEYLRRTVLRPDGYLVLQMPGHHDLWSRQRVRLGQLFALDDVEFVVPLSRERAAYRHRQLARRRRNRR